MKLLRRGAPSRRKTSDVVGPGSSPAGGASSRRKTSDVVGPGSSPAGGAVSPTRWRVTRVTSTPPKVVTVNGAAPCTSRASVLSYLLSRSVRTLTVGVTATLLIVVVVLVLGLKSSYAASASTDLFSFTEPPPGPSIPGLPEPNVTLPGGYKVIKKIHWGGRPTRPHPKTQPPHILPHPTHYLVISSTVGSTCFNINQCSRICRDIQEDQMDRHNRNDLYCNFLVGGDGNVYEGLGWDKINPRPGLHQLLTRNSVDVCFIGDFGTHNIPTDGQLNAARELLISGVEHEKLSSDYKMFSLNDTTDKFTSPGQNVYSHIRHWIHFTRPNAVLT